MYPSSVVELFKAHFKALPSLLVRAPGRVNLIGEHTDYNDGFVLPAAIDKAIYFAASPRADLVCRLVAQNLHEVCEIRLDRLAKNPSHPWADYLAGVMSVVQKAGFGLRGVDLVFGGDIPVGSGLSSSAALEAGMVRVLDQLFGLGLPVFEQIKLAKAAENDFVGLNCGIMDMFASVMGQAEACLKLDCRSLAFDYIPFHAPDEVLILNNTGVKHSLVESEYNTRQQECSEGVRLLQTVDPAIRNLRDVSQDLLEAEKKRFPERVFRRCAYVVEENRRVEMACSALKNDELARFGAFMYQSHEGLQHDYEVSCPELDFLVDLTRHETAVLGSRMMGGGFGGCTINLVKSAAADELLEKWRRDYARKFDRSLVSYRVQLSDGVRILAV